MFEWFEKINPLNWVEKFIIKRIAKKLAKAFPKLKDKGVKYIEEHAEEMVQKVKVTIFEYLQKLANKQKQNRV